MAKTISTRNVAKASTTKPLGKPLPGDKFLGIEPAIRFYEIEDGDKTEEGEESEIFIMRDKILTVTLKNLLKRWLLFIDTFDHTGTSVVQAIRSLTVGVF